MGLFNLFKKENQKIQNSISNDNLFKNDLTIEKLFESPNLISEDELEKGKSLVKHHVELTTPLYNLFKNVEVMYGKTNDELTLTEEGEVKIINVKFHTNNYDVESIKKITQDLMLLFGVDDDPWTEIDEIRIENGTWRGRRVDKMKFDIILTEDEGLTLDIFDLNNFLKKARA